MNWTETLTCGFCKSPRIVPYTRELGGAGVIGEIGLCRDCKAVFCRTHGMIGLADCIGSCRKRMCPKCSKSIGEAKLKSYVCDECFFKIAERELST
jgi:hypothetical protein